MAFVKKVISEKNKEQRTEYGQEHQYKPLFGFWDHIIYTDEMHVDPESQSQSHILREQGTRDDPENIEERPPLKGVRLHAAGWISWWGKAERLEFYNDENDAQDGEEKPPYPKKPRRQPKTETQEQYKKRVEEWDAGKPHKVDKKVQGNAMTQKYYVERLLPIYIKAIDSLKEIDNKQWYFQEDGDPSHGIRKRGLAQELKEAHNVVNLKYPAQSPDCNPIEGIWSIIKQRLRNRYFDTIEEMKEGLQEEWSKVTLEEIRRRISDMPRRCELLRRSGGKPIRGNGW